MLVLAIELVFLLLFARALWTLWRGHDPLAGDVALVFGAVSGLFALTLLRALTGEPPRLLAVVVLGLLLAQPVLTLRLVSHVQDLPRLLLPAAIVVYVASAAPLLLYTAPDMPRWMVWLAVGGFAFVEVIAAGYLLAESGRRTGAPRLRLQVAAVSTALFGAALVAAGVGAELVPQIVALTSALGYVAAFMPPRRLRRLWAMTASHEYVRQLLGLPDDSTAGEIWTSFAEGVDEICDADAVVVLARTPGGGTTVVAGSGIDPSVALEHVDFDLLTEPSRQRRTNRACPVERTFSAKGQARFSTRIPLPARQGGAPDHVVLVLSRHRSLFTDDDLDVVRDLGSQAALMASRADAAAERQRLTDELASTIEALDVASHAKSDLLARVSHEFRTPLTVIIGYCAILRRTQSPKTSPLAVDAVDRVDEAGQHLLTMVEEVLDVAKMDVGRLELRPETVDVPELIERVIEEMRPLAARKRLVLSSELAGARVHADPRRLTQVLYNLSSNAIKFTPEGGAVRFISEAVDGEVRISVADTGIGIAQEDQSRVFDEFTQLDVEPSNDGTGLGLAIARRLVTAHGGRTELTSSPGEGSQFTVVLPRAN